MIRIPKARRWLSLAGPFVLLLLVVTAGCGPGEGTVSGQVLYKGKPLPGGTVVFTPVDSRYLPGTSQIDEKGHYEIKLTAGEYHITVDNRGLKNPARTSAVAGVPASKEKVRGGPAGGITVGPPPEVLAKMSGAGEAPKAESHKAAGKYVEIPPKYYDAEQSGLTMTVASGPQTHDIELK